MSPRRALFIRVLCFSVVALEVLTVSTAVLAILSFHAYAEGIAWLLFGSQMLLLPVSLLAAGYLVFDGLAWLLDRLHNRSS